MKPKVCVEIGSARGKSTYHIAQALRENLDGRLYAIDPHHATDWNDAGERDTLPALRRNLRAMGGEAYVEIIRSGSAEAARRWKRPIDLLFIDGDHSYDACKADIAAWAPFVKRGGVIAFHDFGSRADGVTRAIFEATKAGRVAEIVGVANTIIAFRM